MIKDFKARQVCPPGWHDALDSRDHNAIRSIVSNNRSVIDSYWTSEGWPDLLAGRGELTTLKLLFELGFSINFREAREGYLPICSASRSGHADVVAYLISLGQPLDVSPSVCNPLMGAISGGRSAECVRLLLDAGIDAGHRYKGGPRGEMTATAYAVMHGLPEIADMIAAHLAEGDENKQDEILKDAYRILKKQPPMKQRRILPSKEDLKQDDD